MHLCTKPAPSFMGWARPTPVRRLCPRTGQRSGKHMRVSNFSWALCATILVAGSAQADRADEPFGILDDSPRFMLYVHKEIGGARRKSAGPSFGFAVDRTVPLTLQMDRSAL